MTATNSKYTPEQVKGILGEVMDKDKILLTCGQHLYLASDTPPKSVGCKNCWEAYWWYKIASTPPHLREARLEMIYRAVYDAVKAHERGEFDFLVSERPEITVHKDAYDEKTGTEKLVIPGQEN